MKRNKKYYKELPEGNLMNGLKHIVLFLGIGILFAQEPPEEFQFNQSPSHSFYYFDSVTINGDNVDPDDWVGAFNGDICVGARKWDTSQCGNGVCDAHELCNTCQFDCGCGGAQVCNAQTGRCHSPAGVCQAPRGAG